MVWALPVSIATTKGITICFLFLQVLRCFSSLGLLPASGIWRLQRHGFPHSEIRGSSSYLHLPAAYRSLSRPSSSLRAKASTIRPYLLSLNIYKLKNQLLFQHVKELSRLRRVSKNIRNRTVVFPPEAERSTIELIFKIQYIKNENIDKICGE